VLSQLEWLLTSLYLYLYLWMMDHRSISFRAGPYRGSHHLASSWRSWLMVLLRCVAARSSSCWRLFEKRRTSLSRVYSASCTASDYVLLCVHLIPLAGRRSYCRHFLFRTESWKFQWGHLILRLFLATRLAKRSQPGLYLQCSGWGVTGEQRVPFPPLP